jgi:hypothetical protein
LGGFWQCVYATPSFPFAVLYTVDEDARVIEIIRLFPRLAVVPIEVMDKLAPAARVR